MGHPTKYKVLIFPAGSEIAVEIFDALKLQKDIEVYGATSVPDHSEFLYRHLASGLPFFNESSFLSELNSVLDKWGIDFLYPARDDVQLFLTQHANEIHARIATSPLDTVEICRSKKRTYEFLAGEDFVPHTFASPEEVDKWPIFAKPAEGEGSKGAQLVHSASEMTELMAGEREYVFCEYLPGTEYSVDCFTDGSGVLQVAVPRTRLRTKAGISVRSAVVDDEDLNTSITRIAEKLNERFTFTGAWFFQLREREDGTPILMEVSPRVPGTMELTRNKGINFPLLTLYTLLGYELDVMPNAYGISLDKAFISRYDIDYDYDTVYVDYDDTLYLGEETNAQAMAFLYQCKNRGKRIVLLTRHDDELLGELSAHMKEKGISESLFSEIVHLNVGERKTDYIAKGERAIFIDDSFSERKAVQTACGIPVFDVSNIEALIDWRH